jgi:CRISPR/Cas system-associated protein endoribonuclease Cas2
VRIKCTSRQAARELRDRLRAEGLPSVQRSNYVLVGARDEDSANALAERVRAEAPPGSIVTTEGTAATVLAAVGPNPFAIFGGLGA